MLGHSFLEISLDRRTFLQGTAALLLTVTALYAPGFGAAHAQPVAPRFEVDPFWPKPLPNHWLLGSTVGVAVDERDHVWIIHRGDSLDARFEATAGAATPEGGCCTAAPPVLEFDPEGNLVGYWGGPSETFDWPSSNHGISIDPDGNVWIGGNGETDAHVLKFTGDGEFLLQLGEPGASGGSLDTRNFGRAAKISFDAAAGEAFIADGYGNRRVVVVDIETGAVKRFWGAYGNRPDDGDRGRYDPDAEPAEQFRTPVHCAEPARDDFVYVCDRVNDRIQVFRKDGTFVNELRIAPRTLGGGSVWDIALSADPEQRFLYVADGSNRRVWIVERASMRVLTSFGDGGRQPGQFYGVHSIATDSRGNVYTTETFEGKRVQRFLYRGEARVESEHVGVPWPE